MSNSDPAPAAADIPVTPSADDLPFEDVTENVSAADETASADERDEDGARVDDEPVGRRPSQATIMVELATANDTEFWRTPEGEPYATVSLGDHRETFPLKGKAASRWVQYLYFEHTGSAPASQPVQDALNVLRAKALFEGPQHPVFIRIAGHEGRIYLDLADERWRAVEVGPAGWRVVDSPPVRFRRSRGMLALPEPERGGCLDDLKVFLNIGGVPDFRMLVSIMVGYLFPSGPYPVLPFYGEQGSAKSTLMRIMRALIDPNEAPLRAAPRDEHDLVIAANNGHILAFDNLSSIPPSLADAICRLATGGGFATRELYSDADEVLFNFVRPVIINGITDLIDRPDLLDRAIPFELPRIDDTERKREATFWRDFERQRPRILGALLDAVVVALRDEEHVRLDRLPRMADFAQRAAAAAPAIGWSAEEFMAAYSRNQADVHTAALEDSVVGTTIKHFIDQQDGRPWTGNATELLDALNQQVNEVVQRRKDWPKSPRGMTAALKRLAPVLRSNGVDVDYARDSKKRTYTLTDKSHDPVPSEGEGAEPSQPSSPSASGTNVVITHDGCARGVTVDDSRPSSLGTDPEHERDGVTVDDRSLHYFSRGASPMVGTGAPESASSARSGRAGLCPICHQRPTVDGQPCFRCKDAAVSTNQ